MRVADGTGSDQRLFAFTPSKLVAMPWKTRDGDRAMQRFWRQIERRESGCWEWVGWRNPKGYGLFSDQSQGYPAHRWLYERIVGPVPSELVMDHLCRNPPCVNPSHLEPVTIAENFRRSPYFPGNRTHCKHGHAFDAANTVYLAGGGRMCRECARVASVRARRNKRLRSVGRGDEVVLLRPRGPARVRG